MDSGKDSQLDLKEFFSAAGPLRRVMPAYQPRPEQITLAEAIQAALWQPGHCLAEAGTGVGKSLAYLAPGIDWALRHQSRLLVSTHTKALQTQLLENELPRLASIFPQPFKYEICVGMENYLCLHRLLAQGGQELLPGMQAEEAHSLKMCLDWCQDQVSGLRQDLPEALPDGLWQKVCVESELCPGRSCRFFEDCFLQQARQRQREAQVLIANHYLFFANLKAGWKLLPEFKAAILDEAHKLEDVAIHFLEDTLAQSEVQQLLHEIGRRGRGGLLDFLSGVDAGTREKIREQAHGVAGQQDQWWQTLQNLFSSQADAIRIQGDEKQLAAPDGEAVTALAGSLSELQDLAQSDEESKSLAYYAARLSEIAKLEQRWFERSADRTVYWVEKSQNRFGWQIRLHGTPLDVSENLDARLFQVLPSVVLTSATLSVGGDFSYVRSRLGLGAAAETAVDSPFPFQKHAALFLPEDVPDPKHSVEFEAYAQGAVTRLVKIFQGGTFVLCTSHRQMRQLAQSLRQEPQPYKILSQGEAPAKTLLEQFQRDGHAVMLGVETFWQGVDVPGPALRCVAITRLPFDVPTHPVHQARAEFLDSQGENPFTRYSIPRAVLMLRQGFGRLIRSSEDRGVVAILDPRVRTRAWGKLFVGALPACPRLSAWKQVQAFCTQHFDLPLAPESSRR